MTAHPFNEAGRAQALRGDDALARAAGDVAAPRRRLLAGLRDAHAEACARIARMRLDGIAQMRGRDGAMAERLTAEAEEQLRRIELLLALLRERPRPAVPRDAAPPTPATLAAEERTGAAEARRLRDIATLADQHLAARLLHLTAEEREATARALEARLH